MRYLDPFLESGEVQEVLAVCRKSRAVQGVVVELDELWLHAWRIGESFNPQDPPLGFMQQVEQHHPEYWWWTTRERDRGWGWIQEPWIPHRQIGPKCLHWHPKMWPMEERLSRVGGEFLPIRLRICLYPPGGERGEPPMFRESALRIVYETRPIARLYAPGPTGSHRPVLGGVSCGVGTQDAGTLGGILKDGNGKYYGLTCAHLAGAKQSVDQPAQAEGGPPAVIGTVAFSEMPPAFPSYLAATLPNQQANSGSVDAALVELTQTTKLEVLNIGKIAQLIESGDLAQKQRFELSGRSSQKVLEHGGFVAFYNLTNQWTGNEHCYEKPLQVRDSTGVRPVQPGDSGAWLLASTGNGFEWAGMIVGGDGQLGFAVSSSAIRDWWSASPRNLQLDVA